MNAKVILSSVLCLLFSATSFADLPEKEQYKCVFQSQDLNAVHATLEMTVKVVGSAGKQGTILEVVYESAWDKDGFHHSIPVVTRGSFPVLKLSNSYTNEDARFSRWDKAHLSIALNSPIKAVIGGTSVYGYPAEAGYATGKRYIEAQGVCVPAL